MKKYLFEVPLVLLLCFSFACQDRAAMAELEKYKAQAKIEEQNEALVRTVFDGLNQRKEAVYQEIYAPEYGWRFPSNNSKAMTREEEAGFVKLLWAGFPDIHWDIVEMVSRGDRVIARYVARGTHKGEYQGLLPTGNTFEGGGIWMGRIKDGKIVDAREDFDVLGWMQQLGMELKPIQAKKK
ncbi:MAG: ester cyclase [Candidatus Aminicenantales bacterium]|jgi:ketosteroid isomerase-like protein